MNLIWCLLATGKLAGKTALIGLLFFGMAGRVVADATVSDLLAIRTGERLAHIHYRAIPMRAFEPGEFDGHYSQSLDLPRVESISLRGCGGGRVESVNFEQRKSKLPADPVLVLGDVYLRCTLIKAVAIEPAVVMTDYPRGYFGDYEYAGWLVTDRFEFSDEPTLKRIFQLLVEAVASPDYDAMFEELENDSNGTELKLADYRKQTGFVPEMVFELVGEKTLRMEINLTRGRLLIQTGEKWDGYMLDRWSGADLRALLSAERERQAGNR